MANMDSIFTALDLDANNGLFFLSEDKWKDHCELSERVKNTLEEKLKPYAFFYFNKTPFILFFDNPADSQKLHEQIWNFNQTPVIVILNQGDIEIYNGFSYIKGLKKLDVLAASSDLGDFEFFKIVTGESWEKYHEKLKSKNRVDHKLLDNIKVLRKQLISDEHKLHPRVANNLIGRILFIRYLIDRKVRIGFRQMKDRLWSNADLCDILTDVETTYDLFRYLKAKDKYNGDLFPFASGEAEDVKQSHLNKIIRLLRGDDLEKGQLSLFDVYDFSIIPVELVSNVYEFFIGEENQQSQGAYYTPLFLVDYILSETVSKYLKENKDTYECKTLDPSCGSGIFLVETLRKIILQYKNLHPDCESNKAAYHEQLKKLLKDNIFGVDVDPDAINVAIFSLYVTLLDFIEKPTDVEDFHFPPLLNENFFAADFFDLEAGYNEVLKQQDLRFIVGNPPWGKVKKSAALYGAYWKNREKTETQLLRERTMDKKAKVAIKVSNEEISEAFLIRVSDFAKSYTQFSFIIKSRSLYKSNAQDFRKYLLSNFKINNVLEISSVRFEIFDKSNDSSVHPAAILSYSYSPNHDSKNIVTHISLKPNRFFTAFKLLVIEKFDKKEVPQNLLLENDWLWKVLVYGNILDYYLIKKLKTSFRSLGELNKTFLGFQRGNRKDDIPDTKGWKILNYNDGSKIRRFSLLINKLKMFNQDTRFERIRNPEYFTQNKLIVSQAFDGEFTDSYISDETLLFSKSYVGILNDDLTQLEKIQMLLSSKLFNFWMVANSSYYGIERDVFIMDDLEGFPLNLDSINQDLTNSFLNFRDQVTGLSVLMTSDVVFNQNINQHYSLTQQEQAIVDYSVKVTIPSIHKKTEFPYNAIIPNNAKGQPYLQEYAEVIANHFNQLFKTKGKKISVLIHYSKYTIAIEFQVNDISKDVPSVQFFSNQESKDILRRFSIMSYAKVSEGLFLQKDIKGFEEESFYIVKPNEYKCWHRAIAYLDLGEFLEAMMKAGSQKKRHLEYVGQG